MKISVSNTVRDTELFERDQQMPLSNSAEDQEGNSRRQLVTQFILRELTGTEALPKRDGEPAEAIQGGVWAGSGRHKTGAGPSSCVKTGCEGEGRRSEG